MRPANLRWVAAISLVVAVALVAPGCAGRPQRLTNPEGEARIGSFVYRLPGPGWRGVQYRPSASGGVGHDYKLDGDRLQFQLSTFEPVRAVRTQADVMSWARQAGGPNFDPDTERAATCARYAHRWTQTLSLGGPAKPWATIEERGLFCIDPGLPNVLLHVRVLERLAPGAPASPDFDEIAQTLISSVKTST